MKIVKAFFSKMCRLYTKSYLSVHTFLIALTTGIYLLINKNGGIDIDQIYIEMLNGMGILTSFFILVIDKINIRSLGKRYPDIVKAGLFKKYEINEGTKLMNTLFSLTISMFLILGLSYILLLFKIKSFYLLIMLIVYIFVSFVITISIWHAFELKEID
ncbi:hypothetical protein PT105_05750 [Erysipelothrix rhusiopathiae]|nr:hypothetical protein [Erysipelothrix rhusiopathiae]